MNYRRLVFSLVSSIVLVGSYFFLPKYGFTFHGPLLNHFLYPFSHANIWHLAGNVVCLWMMKCRPYIFATYLIAALCSFLPCPQLPLYGADITEPTMGFSGVLFAMAGASWGKVGRYTDMLKRNKWYLIIPAFLPNINFMIHLYCLSAGFIFGLCVKRYETS